MVKAVVLDANLLVLLVVGLTNPKYIKSHKRLRDFDFDDYRLLGTVIDRFGRIVVTPNVLTEASNLLRQIADPAKTEISLVFAACIDKFEERYIVSRDAMERSEFQRLGLADVALLDVNKAETVMLTADHDLWNAALVAGYEAMNFRYLRQA